MTTGRRLPGQLHQELFHRVRPNRPERHRDRVQDSACQRLRPNRRRGDQLLNDHPSFRQQEKSSFSRQFQLFTWAKTPKSDLGDFQICSTQYESECVTEQEVHQVNFLE